MKKMVITTLLLLMFSLIFADGFYDIDTVNTIELTFEETNWNQLLKNLYSAGNEERLLGTATINGTVFDSVGVRYKGNSSYSSQRSKNPLNIKLDYIIDDQAYEGYGTLKLSNGYNDPSMVRETLSYEIAGSYMPASKANYANVSVNGSLIGLYTNIQDVDKFFKNTNFPGAPDVRFKGELTGNGGPQLTTIFGYFGADSTDYYDYYEIESDTGWQDLVDFLDVFNNSDQMEDYLNIDNHLWMLAFDNLLVNLDSPINFGHNFYLFKDSSDRFNPIIWDLNESFGVFSMLLSGGNLSSSQKQTLDPLLNANSSSFPIISEVLSNDKYQKMYIAHMRTIIEEYFENGLYETRALEIQNVIDEAMQNDPNKLYTYNNFLQNIDSSVSSGGGPMGSVIGITELMDTRYAWLLNQSEFDGDIPEMSNVNHTEVVEANSTANFTVETVNVDQVWINYRNKNQARFWEVEMFDDGNHNDGASNDGTFGTDVEISYQDIEYYFYAQNSDLGAFMPARAASEFYDLDVITESGDIVINEINYHSSDDFDTEDWVELYNPDTAELNISGWEFNDEDDSHSYIIPDDTVIGAEGYLVLCKDSALFSSLFPSVSNYIGDFDFGLSGGGEPIRIFDGEGTLIDSVDYDDEGDWVTLPDGNGNTLELIDSSYDNTLGISWQASAGNGSPGEPNSSGVSADDDITVLELELSNYPNPFNPQTTIEFSLPTQGKTTLEIYNAKGQKVNTLINETLSSGNHSTVWYGDDNNKRKLSSGIYFYRLNSQNLTKTKKMILLK